MVAKGLSKTVLWIKIRMGKDGGVVQIGFFPPNKPLFMSNNNYETTVWGLFASVQKYEHNMHLGDGVVTP